MKKTIVLILAALVLATMLVIPALAADGTASVSAATGKSGENVSVTVSFAGFEQATTIGVSINSELTFLGGNWLLADGMLAEVRPANKAAAWQADIGETAVINGKALELQFQLPAYTGVKSYSVSIEAVVKNGTTVLGTVTATGTVTVKNPAESVTMSQNTLALDLCGTKTGTLTATAGPANTTDTITWSSSNEAVATVADGVVTGLKPGTATITAKAGTKSATCAVTVSCTHTNAVETIAKNPSCQEAGNYAYWTCPTCNQVLAEDKSTVTTVEAQTREKVPCSGGTATCTAKATCSMCGNPYGEKKPHTFSTAWQTSDTQHWHICTSCNTEKGSLASHSFSWKVDTPATDMSTGLKHEECACGKKRNEGTEIPVQDHVHGDIKHYSAVKATCTKTGTVEYWTCGKTKCAGKYYQDAACQLELNTIVQPIDANNHSGKTELRNKVEATCSKEGYSGDTWCLSCNKMKTKGAVVPATGKHTPKKNYLRDEKQHWQECSVCNTVIGKKTAHTFAWVVDKAATEEATGLKHEACSACKLERNKNTVIDKLPHIPAIVEGKAATCTEAGALEHFYCPNCDCYYASNNGEQGDEIQKETVNIPALGHTFGTEWKGDEKGHWHVCSACQTTSEVESHTVEVVGAVEATKDQEGYTGDKKCSVCGALISEGEAIPVVKQNVVPVVIICSVAAIAACGGGFLLFKKKPWKK